MSTVITTRWLEDADIEPVLDLMRVSLGESKLLQRSSELFRWKHIDNPFGRSIGLVAEDGGEIVGLRTFMRWELVTPTGETLRCVRAVDTATHPDHQRRGIFSRLTEEGIEIARSEGVDLVFNTPNDKSKPGYLKMGWQEVGRIGAMVRPTPALLRREESEDTSPELFMRGARPAAGLDMTDRLPRGLRTPRSPEYLAWRFSSHPTARYFAAGDSSGLAVLRPNRRDDRRELVVADLLGAPAAAGRAAVKAASGSYLATWFSPGGPERAALVRRGFVPVPGFTALTLVMRPLREVPPEYWSMDTWDVAVSDFELL